MNPIQAVHGTPITPKHLLQQMKGASFCVSYYRPDQLEDVIPLLGEDSMLLLDNGAFSAFKQGIEFSPEYWDGFWVWAKGVLDRVPQAVAVVPDVIGGTVAQNWAMFTEELPEFMWEYKDQGRLMMVWHLDEPISYLEHMVHSGFGYIAFGSAGEYWQVGTEKWDARIDEAFAAIDRLTLDPSHGLARPRLHMLRGLGQLKRGRHAFQTADSTNIGQNHHRYKDQPEHVAKFRARIETGRFPAAKCALWPQASYETPRAVTVAEATAECAADQAALAALMAEAVTPLPAPEPEAPTAAPAVFQVVQLDLALPLPYHVIASNSEITGATHASTLPPRDTRRDRGIRDTREKGRKAQGRGSSLPRLVHGSRVDPRAGRHRAGSLNRCRAAVGVWTAGDTWTRSPAAPLHRPLRTDRPGQDQDIAWTGSGQENHRRVIEEPQHRCTQRCVTIGFRPKNPRSWVVVR